jgi:predicted NUDIX family phosphoesterase
MSLVETERVLVVPTELLHRLGYFQGFTADVGRYLAELFNPVHTTYRPRAEVEVDPNFKQLIPYVIFRYRQGGGEDSVFQYRRGKGQGEQRLHSKRSIGIGGHISLDDEAARGDGHPYLEGMRREIAEEVDIGSAYTTQLVGLINDDKTEVGKVHLGVVHVFDVETPHVVSREQDILNAGFEPVSRLLQARDEFESWSHICLEALFGQGAVDETRNRLARSASLS